MIQGPCKNHPDRNARRRCFSCGAFICATCQIRGKHHFFCSPRCQLRFQFGEFGNHVIELLESLWPSLPFKKQNALLGKLIAGGLLMLFVLPVLALIFVIVLNLHLSRRIAAIESDIHNFVSIAQAPAGVPEAGGAKLQVNPALLNATVEKHLVSVEGVADTNLVVIVSKNKKILSAIVPRDGRFASPMLELEKGENQFEVNAVDVSGNVVGFEKIVMHYRPPVQPFMSRDFSRGNREQRRIALTFDGGSNDNAAAPILEILKQQNIKATIFLTGGFIQQFPELTKEIVAQDHEVGNHTWSHPHLTSFAMNYQQRTLPHVTQQFIYEQLNKTAVLFESVTGTPMAKLWRAPFGEHNQEIRQWAAELGYRHIGWTHGRTADESMDTMDWVADTTSSAYRSSDQILERLLRIARRDGEAANGGILLMHLGSERRGDEAYQILPQLIDSLRSKHYELVTVSQLLN